MFLIFSDDLQPIVPPIMYKDVLQAKKSAESTKAAEEAKPDEADEAANVSDDDDLNEPINEDEEVAPPDIEGLGMFAFYRQRMNREVQS
jgi:hypothetical protein